ncbi:hypothetical protein O181_001965 [Austropuccinia psidii MF-1]|uniref:Integrase catalytic domain-containing protein n=1 Tax=Austropuccinia psidii MF-1 TaxID=1389203 RepID=A0A9Q3GCD3_9BASI|nr:hypothetical protein [Austropuccinia psidii MF-1]
MSENVENGFIRSSPSSTGAYVLDVKKKDGGLCLCNDYSKFNDVTRKNRYPVLHMSQLLTVFNTSTIFSKIHLCGAYNLLRIEKGDEHLTAFGAKYGTYEYFVIPSYLTNVLSSFQNLINDIFPDLLANFVLVYLDDVMIFSRTEEEHVKHVSSFLQMLRDNKLFSKDSKCVFHASRVEYLGYVVSSDFLKLDSSSFQQILNWPQPKNIRDLQLSLSFSNFYCYFIKNYSKKITSLTSLLKRDYPFIVNEKAPSQLQLLKEAFTTAPILSHFNPSLPTIVETYASDYSLGAVLSQVNDSGKHLIAFDFITQFPLSKAFDSTLVVVDRLSKMAVFIPTYSEITALDLSEIFISHVLPISIVSDRGYLLVSSLWTQLFQKLKISIFNSTDFNSETDGKTERVNRILEEYLWMYVSYHQDDWPIWLPLDDIS